MKNWILATSILSLATTAGCLHDEEGQTDIVDQANTVIEGTKSACKFVPSVASIAAILGVPGAPIASELADQICAEVAKVPRLESDEGVSTVTVSVDGKEVTGLRY